MGHSTMEIRRVLAPGQDFVEVAKLFVNGIMKSTGTWTPEKGAIPWVMRAHTIKSSWAYLPVNQKV